MLPPSDLRFSGSQPNILAFLPTGRSRSSTLPAGDRIYTVLSVTVNWCLDIPGLVFVKRCVTCGVICERATHASAVHASFKTLSFSQNLPIGWRRKFGSD